MAAEGKLTAAGRTDTGRKRPHNEDAIEVVIKDGLMVLADGMGGYSAGEIASQIAVDTIVHTVQNASPMERGDRLLQEAIAKANRAILDKAKENPEREGMGTTIVVCLFRRGRVTIAHVGDSRVYRLRRSRLERLTTDHSLTQELLERGYYTRMEARQASNRHVITRALGINRQVDATINEEPVAEGDLFLLCSDGLTDMMDDHSIRYALDKKDQPLEEMATGLVRRANDLGGRDNISVILARAGRGSDRDETASPLATLREGLKRLLGREKHPSGS
ncbi:Stp1/IreP family PP2C-type Ser/Thr phosphatase [Natronospira bacteriovora]|uniref:Stp1/IreP family PP2C-type Ser/Thr phosphatase n=1 Tax=Natronospira bacteriovora TaxID=3069753 RepID=A0ABU0W504_9GAMM|nr:Stp1/IreP family PP2C-type Ser/Thr phosphatase [Natronospira sp. AB-CW4]MDQ2068848.1 Stp1/IreP family PP2C-type Ser/Thr phosphatase [Natronospira sp. AB-CW4]